MFYNVLESHLTCFILHDLAVFHPADEEGPESDDEEEEDDNDVSPPLNPLGIDMVLLYTM